VITSQKSVKSLSKSGCGPLKEMSEEMRSPVARSKTSVNTATPASRSRTGPCAVWIFSGRPVKVVTKVTVPAASSTSAVPVTCPAFEMMTELPLAGLVTVARTEVVS